MVLQLSISYLVCSTKDHYLRDEYKQSKKQNGVKSINESRSVEGVRCWQLVPTSCPVQVLCQLLAVFGCALGLFSTSELMNGEARHDRASWFPVS